MTSVKKTFVKWPPNRYPSCGLPVDSVGTALSVYVNSFLNIVQQLAANIGIQRGDMFDGNPKGTASRSGERGERPQGGGLVDARAADQQSELPKDYRKRPARAVLRGTWA